MAYRYMYNIKAAAPPACTRDLEAKSMKRAKAHKMDAIFLSVFFSKCNYIACEHERDAVYIHKFSNNLLLEVVRNKFSSSTLRDSPKCKGKTSSGSLFQNILLASYCRASKPGYQERLAILSVLCV